MTCPLPAVSRKKVAAAFDGGRLSSDSGVVHFSLAERRSATAKSLAALIADPRDATHITHTVAEHHLMLRVEETTRVKRLKFMANSVESEQLILRNSCSKFGNMINNFSRAAC